MPSAIALTYTKDGFVIAADGRARDNGIIISETAQKIFSIRGKDRSLAYALCGTVTFDSKAQKNVIDLLKAAPYTIIALSQTRYENLSSYARGFSMSLYSTIKHVQDTQQIDPFPAKPLNRRGGDDYIIFQLFVAGYYDGHPGWCFATFSHRNQRLLEPTLKDDYQLQKGPAVYGPLEITRRIFKSDDPTVAGYRVKGFQDSAQPSLSDGIEAMKNYVRACCDPEIAKLDQEMCAAVGGHIHVATLTPSDGFSWIICPQQK